MLAHDTTKEVVTGRTSLVMENHFENNVLCGRLERAE